jgi:hypothetical protein
MLTDSQATTFSSTFSLHSLLIEQHNPTADWWSSSSLKWFNSKFSFRRKFIFNFHLTANLPKQTSHPIIIISLIVSFNKLDNHSSSNFFSSQHSNKWILSRSAFSRIPSMLRTPTRQHHIFLRFSLSYRSISPCTWFVEKRSRLKMRVKWVGVCWR